MPPTKKKKIDFNAKSTTGILQPNNFVDSATRYAEDVVNGNIVACWQVKAACRKHLENLDAVKSKIRDDIRYNLFALQDILKFLSHCTHYKTDIGKPFIPEDWETFILANLYAWERYSEESKRWVFKHTDCFIMVAKKNGKSTLLSGCAAFDCLFGEPTGAECYVGAASEEQAKIIWNSTKAFIDRNGALSTAFTTINSTIYANGTDRTSFIKPFGRDSKKEGLNCYSVFIDELHDHPDSEVYTTLSDGMIGRQKKHCVVITTAGNDIYSFCRKQQTRYEQILKGTFESDNTFAIIYAAPDNADIANPDTWKLANPALGTVKPLESMRDSYSKALQEGTLSIWRYKNLCQWTDDKESWIDIAKWNALEKPEYIPQEGMRCYAGLDLAQVNDLCALTLLFPKQDGQPFYFTKSFFWIPQKTAKIKQLSDKIPFKDWERNGHITISHDDIIRLSLVADFIVELTATYNLQALFFDRAMSREVEAIMRDNGINAEPSFQGFGLSKDIKKTEELIFAKELFHDGNPCLTWNLSNAAVKLNDKSEKMLVKPIGYRKIDGCISLVDSIGAMTVYENNLNKSATKRTSKTFRHTV